MGRVPPKLPVLEEVAALILVVAFCSVVFEAVKWVVSNA